MRLLLVEDEPTLAELLMRRLRKVGYAVDVAGTCREAASLATETSYDVVVLDLKLPDGSGVDLIEQWRRDGMDFPTLILTAQRSTADKVRGLDAGADDYLTKPFDFQELLARLRSLVRRRNAELVPTLEFEDIVLDTTDLVASRGGVPLELTAKELALLEYFLHHPGRVLSRSQIAEHVWDDRYRAQSNVIDVLVGRLRRKLETGGRERLIHTVKGLGYVLRRPLAGHGS